MVERVPESISFPAEEEKILQFWKEKDCFRECIKQSKNRPRYTFYDGPPFATGLPHYGHILAGTIKDIVTRFAHQSGFHVERRFGWDCHGLPVDESVSLIAWTTTPWTLPSNLALCVNAEFQYVKVKDNATEKTYIMMESRLGALFKSETEYTLLDKFPGKALKGKKYKPLFPYFAKCGESGAFQVVTDNYVREEEGTGVVHQAPYFGADDFRVCMEYNIIQRDQVPICPVDASGCFTAEVLDFAGQYVKDADKNIIKLLKETGRMVNASSFKHSYPFCWRSDTPLMLQGSAQLVCQSGAHGGQIAGEQWEKVPEFVGEKRWCGVGSVARIGRRLSGVKVTDLHRESIDGLTIPSRCGKGALRRITEVFDCWFESGSMPYAQAHYPFENRKEFEDTFPADFIAEGIDQTRGWFYTLLVLSTALFGKPPFKNVIVNGLDVFLPWYNAYRFLVQNVQRLHQEEDMAFLYNENTAKQSDNIMDKWIQSFTQSLIQFFKAEMEMYRLYTVVPRLVKFVDMLTNWYVRTNRRRLKGESGTEDCLWALETLFSVLLSMCRLMAPFTPFITEMMYQNLRHLIDPASFEEKDTGSIHYLMMPQMMYQNLRHLIDPASFEEKDTGSIHYLMMPQVRESLIDKRIESAVCQMQSVIELGRVIRDRKTLPVKELNVRQLDHVDGQGQVRASVCEREPDRHGSITVDGHELHEEDLRLMYTFDQSSGSAAQYEAHSDSQVLVLLDVSPDQSMVDEGVAREVINRIQKLRKKGHLVPSDEIMVYYRCQPAGDYLESVIQAHTEFILATTKAPLVPYPVPKGANVIVEEKTQLKGSDLEFTIVKRSSAPRAPLNGPVCAYVNLKVKINDKEQEGVVLLENPRGDGKMDMDHLRRVSSSVFGTNNTQLSFFIGKTELTNDADVHSLSGKTLSVTSSGSAPGPAPATDAILCPYVNLQLCNGCPAELPADATVKSLDTKTLFVSVLPTTAEA
ncbi:hypothetical protein CRUP_021581 [Coryphaenoides rupestris]|nr:hypothetical protein CRUP_021581 [Coryphaenoides rupestris]